MPQQECRKNPVLAQWTSAIVWYSEARKSIGPKTSGDEMIKKMWDVGEA